MFTLTMTLLLSLVGQDVQDDPAADLHNLCKAFVQCESYAFQLESKDEGSGFGRSRMGRGGEQQANQPAPATMGWFQKGQPCQIKVGEIEAYRLDQDVVYRQGEGKWKLFDVRTMRGGSGRRGGEDRQRGEGGGQRMTREEMIEKYDTDGDGELNEEEMKTAREAMGSEAGRRGGERGQTGDFSAMRHLYSMSRITLPHEAMKKIDGKVVEIKCEAAEEESGVKKVYSGVLTSEGAEALASSGFRFGRRRGGDSEESGPAFDCSGTLCLTATEGGRIEMIQITTLMKGSFREREFEQKRTMTIKLSDLGQVKIEVPEEAMAEFAL